MVTQCFAVCVFNNLKAWRWPHGKGFLFLLVVQQPHDLRETEGWLTSHIHGPEEWMSKL